MHVEIPWYPRPDRPLRPLARPGYDQPVVTFEEARRIVADAVRPTWPPSYGTLVVEPYGWEDATHWQLIYGAQEADTDDEAVLMDAPVPLVAKATGSVEWVNLIAEMPRLNAMRRVGPHPGAPAGGGV